MSAPKTLSRYGLLAALEAAYGTLETLDPATHGILVSSRPDVHPQYAHDGARAGHAPGTGAALRRVAKSGRSGTLSITHEAAGAGVAYSALLTPSAHLLLRACGFDATVDTAAGAESYTYAPTNTHASLSLEAYGRGQRARLAGVYGALSIEGEAGGIPLWTMEAQGIMPALPTDVALPVITYAGAQLVDPAKASPMTVQLGDFAPARVRSFSFTQGRELTPRGMDNTNGNHGGFTPGAPVTYQLELVVEAAALTTAAPWHAAATLNPGELAEQGGALPLSLAIGNTQYRRWSITSPAAQLAEDPDQEDGNNAMWRLTLDLLPSALGNNDGVAFIFD